MATFSLPISYGAARAGFLATAANVGARVSSFVHPLTGLREEELAVDVAELGPDDAEPVVLIVSGTHGVEGYCGSALQHQWLGHWSGGRPRATRVVLVHALNPYGFSWQRRVNEDNVDLNRNFVDWTQPVPANAGYDQIADLLVPTEWTGDEQQRTTDALLGLADEWGFPKLQEAITGGQYAHPTGVFYGGTEPVWSHRWLRSWCAEQLGAARQVDIIDLHTGLGPWGVGELIASAGSGDPLYERAKALWPDTRSMIDGDSVSAVLAGDWLAVADQLAPQAEVTPICIEYGTVDPITALQALRADAWLHCYGGPQGDEAPAIRNQMLTAFADDDPKWIAACWERFQQVLLPALYR